MATQSIPPPPPLANDPELNRWLINLASILNAAGGVDATNITPEVALLNSPAFTGTPTAPTPAPGTNNTDIATTAFVLANSASTPYTGSPAMDNVAASGTSGEFSRGDHVHPSDTSRAGLNSPAFTGTPTAPTATASDNSTKLATTAYADSAVAVEKTRAEAAEASLAPLASPVFTGTPEGPTAANGTNTAQLATTAFVQSAIAGGGSVAPVVKAAGYVRINSGGSLTLINSFNIASVTRNAVGVYEITFATALADANYYVTATAQGSSTSANCWMQVSYSPAVPATTGFTIIGLQSAGTTGDPAFFYFVVFE